MIEWFKSFFLNNNNPDEPSAEHQARIAAVALMHEVVRADGEHKDEELSALTSKLIERWQLSDDEASSLLQAARHAAEQAVDYHQLVHTLRHALDTKQRKTLIIDMWNIAHADNHVDPLEEHVIRKVADLLYISHSHFIFGKLHGR